MQRVDVATENLVQLCGGVFKVVLLCDQAGAGTGQSPFGLLQLRASTNPGLVSFPYLREDFFVRGYVFHCQLVKTALLHNLEEGLGRFQGDVIRRIVNIVKRGIDARLGLLDLVGRIVTVEQILSQREFYRATVVIDGVVVRRR